PSPIRARHLRLPISEDKNRSVRKRVIRHEEKRQHGCDASESVSTHEGDEKKEHAYDGAEKQRDGGCSAGVNGRCSTKEEPVTAHGIQGPRAEKLIGIKTAQHGNDHDGADDGIA